MTVTAGRLQLSCAPRARSESTLVVIAGIVELTRRARATPGVAEALSTGGNSV